MSSLQFCFCSLSPAGSGGGRGMVNIIIVREFFTLLGNKYVTLCIQGITYTYCY